jgi:RNA polymerase sigma-70 factor (ECF subfamily)
MTRSSVREASEVTLLELSRTGDEAAYRVLSERYLKPILNHCLRMLTNLAEAEDVTQETFLKLWQSPPDPKETPKVSTWLYRVAHNRCVDVLRKRRDTTTEDELAVDSVRPSRALERKQTAEAVQGALARLPERQRSALCLSHYEGMSNPEIALVLGVSVEATESLLSRARRTLREALCPEGAEP